MDGLTGNVPLPPGREAPDPPSGLRAPEPLPAVETNRPAYLGFWSMRRRAFGVPAAGSVKGVEALGDGLLALARRV
jgi:hypothetical protein